MKFKISIDDNGTSRITTRKWCIWVPVTDKEFESYVECEDYLRENYKDYKVRYERPWRR